MKHRLRYTPRILVLLALLCGAWLMPAPAYSQGYINQEEIEDLLNRRADDLDALPEVFYEYRVLEDPFSGKNHVMARHYLYKQIGDGNVEVGKQRAQLVELLNRVNLEQVALGDTLVVPTEWELDYRAYSPFPRYYPGGRSLDKLFIIDKSVQAFAAYEYGKLARWGVVNTGSPKETPTPNGRFNFNWQEEYRVSTLSPPDEEWEMYWVFNFHNARGIHIHQYAFPTGGPTSHGCVRLIDADAKWIYDWADPWKTTVKGTGIETSQGRLIEPGSTVLVIGDDPTSRPHPFEHKKRYPVLVRVDLPRDPYAVPPGSRQQEILDRKRASASR